MESDSKDYISCKSFIELLDKDTIIYIHRCNRSITLDSISSKPYYFKDIEFYKILMYFIDTNTETY